MLIYNDQTHYKYDINFGCDHTFLIQFTNGGQTNLTVLQNLCNIYLLLGWKILTKAFLTLLS